MKKAVFWILLTLIFYTCFSITYDYEIKILDFTEEELVLQLKVLFEPIIEPSLVLYTPAGVIKPYEANGNIFKFKIKNKSFAIPMIFSKNTYGRIMTKIYPTVIDLNQILQVPKISVFSDIKENGQVFKYIKTTFPESWKVENVSIDGENVKWFRLDGKIISFTTKEFDDGVHELEISFSLPYNTRKTFKWKLFSWKNILVPYRGDVMPYVVEKIPPYIHIVQSGETLWSIAKNYNLRVGDLVLVNGLKDPDLIYAGQPLKLGRVHFIENPVVIVINLFTAKMGVYYDGKLLNVFPVAIGRSDSTPPGKYWILRKEQNPVLYWYGEYIPPSPINGLGTRYLQLSDPRYGIHGTSKPWEIGRRISHGCIRMFNHDVELLDDFAGVGSSVIVIKEDKEFEEDLSDLLNDDSFMSVHKRKGVKE